MRGGGTLDGATLVTPCYPPDRPRLDVLRASLAACGVDAPHVVMVDAHLADDPEPALAAIRREWARLAEAGPGPVRGGDERGGRPT